ANINPHFIFNALNGIRALIDEDPARARKAVTELSNILRSSLNAEKGETVSLEDELKIVKDYLALENMRFEDRLKIEYEIDDETSNAEEGIQKIENHNPDLIFLDIQMPGKTGFDMLSELDHAPQVIFTTAYDEYALKAFEVNALDYLLKPVEPRRLADAVEKLRRSTTNGSGEKTNNHSEPTSILGENDQVFVKDGERCWFVKLSEVRLF